MTTQPLRAVVMSVPFGGGHNSVASAIRETLERDGKFAVTVIDVIADADPQLAASLAGAYAATNSRIGKLGYKVYYWLSDRFPAVLRWYGVLKFGAYARQKWGELQPDIVIATFPFLGHVAAKARDFHGSAAPVVTVVTDASRVQGIWLCGNEDAIITATEDTIDYAVSRGVDRRRLVCLGTPLRKRFEKLPSLGDARQKLGLAKTSRVATIMSGAGGLEAEHMYSIGRALADAGLEWQYVFVCGVNDELRQRLEALAIPGAQVLGFTDDIPELYAASDVVCTKAGWLTISELMAAGTPFAITSIIPGQETQNAHYVQQRGVAPLCLDADAVVAYLRASQPGKVARSDTAARINTRFYDYCTDLVSTARTRNP